MACLNPHAHLDKNDEEPYRAVVQGDAARTEVEGNPGTPSHAPSKGAEGTADAVAKVGSVSAAGVHRPGLVSSGQALTDPQNLMQRAREIHYGALHHMPNRLPGKYIEGEFRPMA